MHGVSASCSECCIAICLTRALLHMLAVLLTKDRLGLLTSSWEAAITGEGAACTEMSSACFSSCGKEARLWPTGKTATLASAAATPFPTTVTRWGLLRLLETGGSEISGLRAAVPRMVQCKRPAKNIRDGSFLDGLNTCQVQGLHFGCL